MMDMPMKDGMEKKDPTFKCPSCGEMLSVESKGESDSEHSKLGMKKPNAGNMPMGQLRNKITPPGMGGY
jgi:hypothetical protein